VTSGARQSGGAVAEHAAPLGAGVLAGEIQESCRDLSVMLDECCTMVRGKDDKIRDDGEKVHACM